jgi:hypothetical protein
MNELNTENILARIEALDDESKESAQAIMSDLVSALENQGTAVVMVDAFANGSAATAYVGGRDAAYALLTATKEAYDTLFFKRPEGVSLQ